MRERSFCRTSCGVFSHFLFDAQTAFFSGIMVLSAMIPVCFRLLLFLLPPSVAVLSRTPGRVALDLSYEIVPEHRYFTPDGDFLAAKAAFLQRCQNSSCGLRRFLGRKDSKACPRQRACNCTCSCPEILYKAPEAAPEALLQGTPCSGPECGPEGCPDVAPCNCYCACRPPVPKQ